MKSTAAIATLLLVVAKPGRAAAFAAPAVEAAKQQQTLANKAIQEWLSVGNRFVSDASQIVVDDDGDMSVVTTRMVDPGQVIFRLKSSALWCASDAYKDDRDISPKLQDYARQAGREGFDVIALAGVLAAEKVRRYRIREGLGVAPESSGFIAPSRWGALARWIWSTRDDEGEIELDESIADVVGQGVTLLVPLLDVVARRYWTAADKDVPDTQAFDDERWTRQALIECDGGPPSWSRTDLERVALQSIDTVLNIGRYPPPHVVESKVGSMLREPYVAGESPGMWPKNGDDRAFVPLMDSLLLSPDEASSPNAAIGSPQLQRREQFKDDCMWVVATKKLQKGECVRADPNLWK